jgi:hypothetical protein
MKASSSDGLQSLARVTYHLAAKLVFSLGLRRAPPLSNILCIAASDDPTVRTKALVFFLEKISDDYSNYHPHDFRHLAFIPAILGSEKILAKPYEVRDLFHQDFPFI